MFTSRRGACDEKWFEGDLLVHLLWRKKTMEAYVYGETENKRLFPATRMNPMLSHFTRIFATITSRILFSSSANFYNRTL
jgi:hypothetical protein